MIKPRLVADTNVLITRALSPKSSAALALDCALKSFQIIRSEATLAELKSVIFRKKFNPYITDAERQRFLQDYMSSSKELLITERINICRDPKDNMFLDLAVQGDARYILTGDQDLLALHPFMDIQIISPSDFLREKL